MNIKFKLLLLSLSICINQNSFAETKIRMVSPEDNQHYLLKDTIKTIKPHVYRYWTETIYKKDRSDNIGIVYEKGQYTRQLQEVDCQEDTLKTITITTYNEDGNVAKTATRKDNEIVTNYIVSGSYGDAWKKQICNMKRANK